MNSKIFLVFIISFLATGAVSAEQIRVGYTTVTNVGQATTIGCIYGKVSPDGDPVTTAVANIELKPRDAYTSSGGVVITEVVHGQKVIWMIAAQRSRQNGRLSLFAEIKAGRSRSSFEIDFSRRNELIFPVTGTTLNLGINGNKCYQASLFLGPAQ